MNSEVIIEALQLFVLPRSMLLLLILSKLSDLSVPSFSLRQQALAALISVSFCHLMSIVMRQLCIGWHEIIVDLGQSGWVH